ncbi:MAG: dTDP-glucose 4,6-dehydratase [Gammaproteobacteria bacterium RIFCSPHIGHO2_12_FULL_38_11]|nr:MAG: dTDP-glucose 4,6-dehydratase [Gammaproteobacteria bacterium RIFCSPHIGHO2_12_FULL_38_11]
MTHLPKKILVTGSAGFIGSNFVRLELQHDKNIEIISLDKLTYAGNLKNLENLCDPSRHKFIQGDICDERLLQTILKEHQIDSIVHFAAESHVDRSILNPRAFIDTNILGTFNLLQAARENKIARFHHISTDEVYGSLEKNTPAFTEENAYQPNSPYSASKAGSDHLVRAFAHTYGLPITLSNCSNNYGVNQHPEKFIPTVIRACIEKKTIPVYGDGLNIRDWIFVDDHCAAVSLIIREGKLNQTYNVGGNCELSNLQLVKTICELMDKRFSNNAPHYNLIEFVTDRLGHDWRYAIDNTKIQTTLGWKPTTSLRNGLEKTIDYYVGAECDRSK